MIKYCDFELKDLPTLLINGFKSAFLHYKQRVNLIDEALDAMGIRENGEVVGA
jgi:adenosine deaminase